MKKTGLVRLSFSIEEDLNEKFETLVRSSGYQNRSEYIRDMIRKTLTRRHCADGCDVIGTVSVLYHSDRTGLTDRIRRLRQDASAAVLSSCAVPLEDGICSEMFMARGKGSAIRDLAASVRKLRGVIQTEFVITSPEENVP